MNNEPSPQVQTIVESVLQASWKIPLWLVVLYALLCGLFVAWIYTSERAKAGKGLRLLLATLRFVLLMTVLWMLAGWGWLRFRSDQPEMLVVIDRSASMNTNDGDEEAEGTPQTRFERAQRYFENLSPRRRAALLKQYQMRWYSMSESLEPLSVDLANLDGQLLPGMLADGTQSRLGDGLVRLIERQAGKGTAAIIFISDGINTSGAALSDAAKAARRAAIPIHVISVGRQYELPDLRLADLLIDREVYLGDQVTAEVTVLASDVPSAETRILLRDRTTDKILDETRLSVNSQQQQANVRLSFVPDKPGDLSIRIEASAIDGETELSNNTLDAIVRVQDKTIRVLLVSEFPSYEFRFLKSFLERAQQAGEAGSVASFELNAVLQDSDPEYVEQDQSAMRLVPSNPQTLAEYDAFVLLDFDPQLVSQSSQQAIVEAVTERGAGCIFVWGSGAPARRLAGWPLGKLLPVENVDSFVGAGQTLAGNLSWQPTALGGTALPMQLASSVQESLDIWTRLPEFAAICQTQKVKEGAQVIGNAVDRETGQSTPLLITQFAAAGRTALQATDETYRWTSVSGSDLYYQRYWGQMLRWLSRGKLTAGDEQPLLLVDPRQVRFGQPVRFQVTLGSAEPLAGDAVAVAIEGEAGRRETLDLLRVNQAANVFQATSSDFKPGSYRALLVQPVTASPPSEEFTVIAPPGEQASLRANVEGLKLLAEQSRGRFYLPQEGDQALAELPPGKPTRLGSLPSIPLWNRYWVALFFVTLLTLEWVLRRSCHML